MATGIPSCLRKGALLLRAVRTRYLRRHGANGKQTSTLNRFHLFVAHFSRLAGHKSPRSDGIVGYISVRATHVRKLLTHMLRWLSAHAAEPLSHTVTRHCIVPTTGDDAPVLSGCVFISQCVTVWPILCAVAAAAAAPHPPSLPERSLHLPLSISEPPDRLVRDGGAPAAPSRPAAGHSGHLDPLRS